MAILASSAVQVLVSGTAVVMTNEACSVDAGFVYKITNSAHRCIDPATALVVKENGVTSVAALTVDLLRGRITFPGAPTAPVTVTGAYLPLVGVNYTAGFKLSIHATNLDTSKFDGASFHVLRELQGLLDAGGTIDVKQDLIAEIDATARKVFTDVINFTPFIVKLARDGTYDTWLRVVVDAPSVSSAVNALNVGNIPFKLSPVFGTGTHGAAFQANVSFGAT